MAFTWSILRSQEPTTLAAARSLAHRALQWPARAARANLKPAADDSHTSLTWHPDQAALLTQLLPGGVKVGLRIGVHELVFIKGSGSESLPLGAAPDADVGQWLDARLAAAGLAPASGVALPYELPHALFARPSEEMPRFAAVAGWIAAGAEVLDEVRKKCRRFKPGPGPVRCWPHHFDIAVLVRLEQDDPERARAIGVGVSPGDDYYAQPYLYVSPYPRPGTDDLPALPAGGRWHTKDFFGAIATGTDLLALEDPKKGMLDIIEAAFAEGQRRLGAR
jgi:hypothetical protein